MARFTPPDSHKKIADIFSKMKSNTRDKLMKDLEERNHDAAERVRGLMFTFDDLGRIDARGMQELLRQIAPTTLALALKGADEARARPFYDNMSARAAKLLREDVEALGPVRTKDVEAAQAEIAAAAQALAESGKIVIPEDGEPYVR